MADNQWSDELRGPEETPRRPDPSHDQWEGEAQPPKAGMSGGMKAFLILAAVLGCCCVLCCGIVGFFAYSFFPKVSQNAADVNAARGEIAKIELPAGFTPVHMIKIDNFMMSMTAVGYRNPAIHGEITLAEMRLKVGEAAQRDQADAPATRAPRLRSPQDPQQRQVRDEDDQDQRPGLHLHGQTRR